MKIKQSEYPKQEKTLYCFKLDEERGKIERIEITEYKRVCVSAFAERYSIMYKKTGYTTEVHESNLDKLINWKIHTFNPNETVARETIIKTIKKRKEAAQYEFERWSELINKIER